MMEDQETGLGEPQRQWAKIVAQAWADADYKARLLADPAAVAREAGVDLPAGVDLRVVENTADKFHLVLPALPDAARDDAQLDVRVAPFCCCCGEIPKCTDLPCDGPTCGILE